MHVYSLNSHGPDDPTLMQSTTVIILRASISQRLSALLNLFLFPPSFHQLFFCSSILGLPITICAYSSSKLPNIFPVYPSSHYLMSPFPPLQPLFYSSIHEHLLTVSLPSHILFPHGGLVLSSWIDCHRHCSSLTQLAVTFSSCRSSSTYVSLHTTYYVFKRTKFGILTVLRRVYNAGMLQRASTSEK